MTHKSTWKRIALASLLLLMALGITGCLAKPDKVDELPTDPGNVLPFATATPTPTPLPTQMPGQGGEWGTDTPVDGVTQAPGGPTPTIQLITASPTPPPVATFSPLPTATPTADSTLRNGSEGQAVRNLQQRLKDLGYYSGSVDGSFGAGTEKALKSFQAANGLTADGIAGSRTLSSLNSSNAKKASQATAKPTATKSSAYATNRPTPKTYTPSTLGTYRYLQLGGSGSDVKKLQQRLQDLGYFYGSVNGNFGADTQAAVEAFQKRNGLYVDGVAGEDTQRELFKDSALAASGSGSNNINNNNSSVPSTGYRTLQSGLSGDDVKLLQTRLKELGYYTGTLDGKYGASTASAVQYFQQINGITADGVAGSTTQMRLYGTNALYAPTTEIVSANRQTVQTMEIGSMGEEIYRLQERLYELGYYTGRIDGIYSDTVAAAVKAFQAANKLTVDGKAGRNTQTKIYSSAAVKASAGGNTSIDNTYATLRQGDSSERVRALKAQLTTYGYFSDTIDNTYDLSTTMAVQQFQLQNGLAADGIAGPATLQLLYLGTPKQFTPVVNVPKTATEYATLRQGMESYDVTMMQEFLWELGYFYEEIDGVFGASTLLAVQAFQANNGLAPDGVAGSATLQLLYSGNGVPSPNLTQQASAALTTPERDKMQQGDEGQDVFTLQERLRTLGYLTSSPDGKFGAGTTSAVKAFQQKNGLTVDGVAGKATTAAMYAANAVPAGSVAQQSQALQTVSNRNRELEEQNATGAIQGSLAGGGVAASHNSSVYYAGRGGTLYMISGSSDKQVFNGPAKYIHASSKGVTFVSNNKIMRIPVGGGSAEVLASGKDVGKLSVVADNFYFIDGKSLVRANANGEYVVLATNVNDFAVDIYQREAYIAATDGVKRVSLAGSGLEQLVSTSADQVMLMDSVVFYRSGGSIYRLQDGISVLLLDAGATWMGAYRDMIYYVSNGNLNRCDTAGLNSKVFYSGSVTGVSFVAGNAYITNKAGGEVSTILPVE